MPPILLASPAAGVRGACASCSVGWRIGEPLVICIDDLQWADADSAVLLEELLRPPSSPAHAHGVVASAAKKPPRSRFSRALLERAGRDAWSAISLEPMTEDEADRLIGALLPADSALTDERQTPHDARSGRQSVRARAAGPLRGRQQDGHRVGRRRLRRCSMTRLGALSPDARRFLETLAICGRPMAPELICDACGVTRERQSLVAMLRSSHFIRSSGSSERVETYHDRIREVLAAQIVPDAVRRIHGLMVQALVERRSDDCEALFEHYRGAGDAENASIQAGLAAEKAATALAFDRAAFFYRHALALTPASSAARAWEEGLANALANAGRPAEAGRRLPARRGRSRSPSASRAPAARRRAVPDRRTHRSRPGPDSHRARGHGHERAAKPPCGAAVVVVATRTAAVARTATSCHGRSTTSTPIPCFASTPAGRRRRDCCWWT